MNRLNPQISLADLATALEAYDGTQIDPNTSNGRQQLMAIAAELLEDPVKGHDLLNLLSKKEPFTQSQNEPWAYKGQVRYLETSEPIDENDFLLDDIDHLRTTNIFGQTLDQGVQENGESTPDVILTTGDKNPLLASPEMLGFSGEVTLGTFDRRAFRTALKRAQRDLQIIVQRLAPEDSSVIPSLDSHKTQQSNTWVDGSWKIKKTIRARNFHELTVSHELKNVYVAYIGSGDDLFLKVDINQKEIIKAKESLSNLQHLTSVFLNTLSNEPDAGVLIVSSILEDLSPPPPTVSLQEIEP
ncbi:hypothetical protein BFW88_07130 [Pseudomonas fluorescens]|nr:hypothetical protein BFW88_07130 [Pseudomonas fluorescens]OPB12844.1 hypothetical protein BFW92_07105 [Pseudomonas fluorescens]OPB25244.1 hypothetical protein BFW93_07125 [Pseudomonas fluorescens]